MNCAEFQKVLPYIIETGGNQQEEGHLRSCPVCSDLVADLKYIAEQAKLLVPMENPSERVWEGIQQSLEREGLVRPAVPRGRLLSSAGWGTWLVPVAALILLGVGFLLYRTQTPATPAAVASLPPASGGTMPDQDDQQLLSAVSQHAPSMRAAYEDNLKQVNAYIHDAKESVEQNPDDADAQQSLIQAYNQKAMLYEMALSRSLQ